jgi:thiol-disulfide isomerase/thioredoxin
VKSISDTARFLICGIAIGLLGLWPKLAKADSFPPPLPGLHAQLIRARPPVYSKNADAKSQIHEALLTAGMESKRVIVDFGANWCPDCRVLNSYFHDNGRNAQLLKNNYVLVEIDVGRFDRNLDIAKKYGVPIKKGIPALVVLDHTGKVLYAQKNGQFEAMRKVSPSDVTAFLEKWKPPKH